MHEEVATMRRTGARTVRAWSTLLGVTCGLVLAASPVKAQQALVLGGGGARGLAHAGVIAGLEARGWDPELVVGTSIGAIIGALYASGLSADSLWTVAARQDWRAAFQYSPVAPITGAASAYPLVRIGIGVDRTRYSEGLIADFRVNRLLTRMLFDAATAAQGDFDRLPRAFRAVAADFSTGEAVVLADGDLALAVRASMAVPGVFPPVLLGGRMLVDGGVADYLPSDVARDLGYTRVVGVDVVRPPLETAGMSPLRAMVRGSRLILMKAAPRDVQTDFLILPGMSPDQSAALFPADATALLVLGRDAALTQAPAVERARVERTKIPYVPERVVDIRVDVASEAMRGLVTRTFRHTLGTYDPAAIFAAADALYATGMFHGVWLRVVARDDDPASATLLVRTDAVPPATLTGGVAYESDRRGRLWARLRARPRGGPLETSASLLLDEMTTSASVGARRPLNANPTFAATADAHVRRTDLRLFDGAGHTGELGVRRAGAALGMEWQRIEPDWAAGLWLVADHIETARGTGGAGTGALLRIGRVPELARVVGTAPLLEAEARFGSVEYRRARMRGSVDVALGDLQVAVLADATVTSRQAPHDARPALGDEHLLPGLRWGQARAPARLVTGLDLALPLVLDIHARARLRSGSTGETLDGALRGGWRPAAELGLTWWTPIGRVESAIGVARGGRPRIDVALGSVF